MGLARPFVAATMKRHLVPARLAAALCLAFSTIYFAQGKLVVDKVESTALADNLVGDSNIKYMRVYLAPSHETSNGRYPVTYVLHWYTGNYTTWSTEGKAAADSLTWVL